MTASNRPEKPQSPDSVHNVPVLRLRRIVAGKKPQHKLRGVEVFVLAALIALIGAGAAVASVHAKGTDSAALVPETAPAAVVKLGYFGNITHGPALVGVQKGIFAKDLSATQLKTQVFTTGPATVEALNAGAIDAAYLGPNPALNSFVQSGGESIRIIAGAASGGAQFVVRADITDVAQLRGKTIATPQLGGTQDVALRKWLGERGLSTNTTGGGDVTINPTTNAQTLQLFQEGKVDGAWVAEPWTSRMVLQAGAKVLVNEADLWDNGEFSTTVLAVNKTFLEAHPQTVEGLLRGHVESLKWLDEHPTESGTVINEALKVAIGKPLENKVIARSLSELTFTADPLAATFPTLLDHGVSVGVSKPADLKGLFELTLLNKVLKAAGGQPVTAAGLGTQ
ncbi:MULTISPECIES: ABC transporter substrate-binding protein [Arthrobacter]|uniref:Sulfonate ABC transporter substrate-binding protein n=1 Tax=Arthrobacter psychrochitiniphilus TaxID=291045 RepID=A0A2V3DV42_9MICC|nr:ABC transporter substrate-binding protein [Arthrobacter psychrochitiniphilus]NYG18830.1 NitT/TauT family transport system substrate-binding protein [Arthrobacter psychrochitiniphilus]PXA66257.1 sulfonate ABC transporter substrate-binding protein [Arthrobacter psychrochitiniphilus]